MPSATCAHCGRTLSRSDVKYCGGCGAPRTAAAAAAPALRAPGARLIVQDEHGAPRVVLLGAGARTLGHAADNDIVLAAGFVSAHHARIEPEGRSHAIVDLGSANGLLSAGHRLEPHAPLALADGDILRIVDAATGGFVTLTYRNPGASRAARAGVVRSYPLDPPGPQATVGRAGNDIVLDNPQVSRHHAVVERAGGGHVLRDLGSTNGTFVNGRRIAERTLAPGDIIQIGPFRLVYDGACLAQHDQRGALRLDAHGLSRSVEHGGRMRHILRAVSLSVTPRELVAVVGGSGAGKSTLLNALAGYAPADEGVVLVNGDELYRSFDAYRSLLGYVPQDDTIHRELPVERALGYAAALRLPADTGPVEIERRIEQVLADVELEAHRETTVRALSGGQRKRVSIGAELLADPSLFFLDEPAAGLDPGLEKKLMSTLRRLADGGQVVVVVTHATANIAQCDQVAFLADGRLVYYGPPGEALSFFNVGSGDFADIYGKVEGVGDPLDPVGWAVVQQDLAAEYGAWQKEGREVGVSTTDDRRATTARWSVVRGRWSGPPSPSPGEALGAPTLAELWERKYRASAYHEAYVAARLALGRGTQEGDAPARGMGRPPKVSLLRQLRILTRRYLELMAHDRRNLLILLLQAPVIGLLLLPVARPAAFVGPQATASDAKRLLIMLAAVSVWFGIINAAREIAKEESIYRRERQANLHIGPYLGSKVIVLALLCVIQSALLIGIVGLRVQLPEAGLLLPAWAELFVTTLLTSLAGLSLGLAISALARTPDRAVSLVPLALIPQILFAGVIFSLGEGVTPQRALSWLTISRWAMDAFGATVNLNALPYQPGMLPLPAPPVEYSYTPEHLLSRWAILGAYALACLLVTARLLKRRDRDS